MDMEASLTRALQSVQERLAQEQIELVLHVYPWVQMTLLGYLATKDKLPNSPPAWIVETSLEQISKSDITIHLAIEKNKLPHSPCQWPS